MAQIILAVLAGLVVTQIANLCTTVYLHRCAAHRALSLRRPVVFGFRVVTWITTGIRPREWVAVHRKHHAFTDVEGDPHSPKLLGWKKVQVGNVGLYKAEASNRDTLAKYAKDMQPDAWDRVLFDRSWLGTGIGIAILILLLGPWLGLLAAAVHTVTYLGTNVLWLALLTGGEGYHNNHHAAPTSARIGFDRWQVDLGWWAIRVLRAFRLARVRLDRVVLAGQRQRQPVG